MGALARKFQRALAVALAVYAVAQIGLLLFLFADHLRFPLLLDLMEGVILQHAERAAQGLPVYPAAQPDYAPLAYNPLFYYLVAPLAWLFGLSLPLMRGVAIGGTLVVLGTVFFAVREKTKRAGWALVAVGLFAAAYRVMVSYLDTAHSDSWMLACALLGTLLLERAKSRRGRLIAMLVLVASFWFKQHGAWFVAGGLAYWTWRFGWRDAWIGWVAAVLLGPVLYVAAGPSLFGSEFLYFTWSVPRRWMQFNGRTLYVLVGFVAISYPLLAAAAAGWFAILWRSRRAFGAWEFQGLAACATAFMGALDPGCSFNVFIPLGTWLIVLGVCGLSALQEARGRFSKWGMPALLAGASFAILWYDPREAIIPASAERDYSELISMLRGLDGPVYAPSIGQLPKDFVLSPAAHWVALEDLVRGPGRDTRDSPIVRELLAPLLSEPGPSYVLSNVELEQFRNFLGVLIDRCVLVEDMGDRFRSLRVLPGRYPHGWPRYLYRCGPPAGAAE